MLAPSVLGVRYLPVMLMAVALAVGERNRRHSVLTFLASFLAAFWSAEAIAGVLALHWGFLTLINLRDRSYRRLVVDLALACLPIVCGLVAMSLGIFLASGKLPAFAIYLGYFASYNPVAAFWSVPFDGIVLGLDSVSAGNRRGCRNLLADGYRRATERLPYGSDYWLRRCLARRTIDRADCRPILPVARLIL